VIGARTGDGRVLILDELYINTEAASLLRWAPVVSELRITHPAVYLLRGKDNRYNVSDVLEILTRGPAGPTPRFSVSNIRIIDGRIDFDDRPEQQKHEITGINIGVPFLSSLPVDTEIQVAPTVAALVNGRPVSIRGETRPFKDTHETVLHWEATGLPVPRYLEYAPFDLPVRVKDGTLDAQLDLTYVGRGTQPAQVTLAGAARLNGLVVEQRSGVPLLAVSSASVTLDRFDVIANRAEIRAIAIEGGELHVRRTTSGELDVATLIPREGSAAPAGKPMQFRVGSVALRHGTVHVADDAVSPAFAASLNDVTIDVTDLGSEPGHSASVSAAFATDAGERLAHKGTLTLEPFVAAGHLDIKGVRLARLLPYYGSALNLAVDDGVLDGETDVRLAAGSSGLALTNLAATVRDLQVRLPDEKQFLWRVPELKVGGGAVEVAKHAVSFDSIELRRATLNVHRDAQGAFNFARLLKAPAGGVKEGSTGEEWRVEARKVVLDGLAGSFVDETIKPPVTLALSGVVATGENFSNAANAKGRLSVRATLNRRGTLTLSGPLATRPPAGTLEVSVRDLELTPFQPYVSPFSGVAVTGGTMSLRGTVDFATSVSVKAAFKGNVALSDVASIEAATQTDLVKWKTLSRGTRRCGARAVGRRPRRHRGRRSVCAPDSERERRAQSAAFAAGPPCCARARCSDDAERHGDERGVAARDSRRRCALAEDRQGDGDRRQSRFHRSLHPSELLGEHHGIDRQPLDADLRSAGRPRADREGAGQRPGGDHGPHQSAGAEAVPRLACDGNGNRASTAHALLRQIRRIRHREGQALDEGALPRRGAQAHRREQRHPRPAHVRSEGRKRRCDQVAGAARGITAQGSQRCHRLRSARRGLAR
jgi:hypothetical protein